MANPVLESRQIAGQFDCPGRPHGMANKTLGIVEPYPLATRKNVPESLALLIVAAGGSGRMRANNLNLICVQLAPLQGQSDALSLAFWVGKHEIGGIGIDGVRDDFCQNRRTSSFGVRKPLEDVQAASFGDHDPIAVGIKRPRGLRRIRVGSEGTLGFERRKDPKRVDTFRYAACDSDIAFMQSEHLNALDNPCVTRRTRGTNRVMGAGDSQVQGDFTSGVVGHGARIVVVGPIGRVVFVLLDGIDFVFGLNISMLGDTDIDPNTRLVDIGPFEPTPADQIPTVPARVPRRMSRRL